MDVNLVSALMQLNGKKSCGSNLKRAEKILKTLQMIAQDGFNQDTIWKLISEINPNLKPLATVVEKLSVPKEDILCCSQDIQYNNFR